MDCQDPRDLKDAPVVLVPLDHPDLRDLQVAKFFKSQWTLVRRNLFFNLVKHNADITAKHKLTNEIEALAQFSFYFYT